MLGKVILWLSDTCHATESNWEEKDLESEGYLFLSIPSSSSGFVLHFETGSLYVTLAVLELVMQIRQASNS